MSLKKIGLPNDRGVALLIVVSVVSLLTVIVLQFNRNMRFNLEEAWSFKDREQLFSVAESGIDLAMAVLHGDSYTNDYDSPFDSWSMIAEKPIQLFDRGAELTVTIQDMSGRLQVNSLVNSAPAAGAQAGNENASAELAREILLRLLQSGEFVVEDDLQAREIVDAIIDWLDSDDKESNYGAEASYYESLDSPYTPRNDLLKLPNELLSVKGVTEELLFGNDEKKALSEYITVFGDSGTININTADPFLIQAFDDRIDSEQAASLVEFREDEKNVELLKEPSWYSQVSGWPGDIELSNTFVTTTSNVFQVRAEATVNETVLAVVAYVKRSGKDTLEILYRKIE